MPQLEKRCPKCARSGDKNSLYADSCGNRLIPLPIVQIVRKKNIEKNFGDRNQNSRQFVEKKLSWHIISSK